MDDIASLALFAQKSLRCDTKAFNSSSLTHKRSAQRVVGYTTSECFCTSLLLCPKSPLHTILFCFLKLFVNDPGSFNDLSTSNSNYKSLFRQDLAFTSSWPPFLF